MKLAAILLAFIGFTISAPVAGGGVDPAAVAKQLAGMIPKPVGPIVVEAVNTAFAATTGATGD
jgi:hypothetical protein